MLFEVSESPFGVKTFYESMPIRIRSVELVKRNFQKKLSCPIYCRGPYQFCLTFFPHTELKPSEYSIVYTILSASRISYIRYFTSWSPPSE